MMAHSLGNITQITGEKRDSLAEGLGIMKFLGNFLHYFAGSVSWAIG
jgi:hypothetical protein